MVRRSLPKVGHLHRDERAQNDERNDRMETLKHLADYLLQAEHTVERYLLNDDKVDIVEALPFVICSAIIWGVLHIIFHEQSKYAVSTFHSVVLAVAGLINLVLLKHNEYEYLFFYFMAGYFLADFFISEFPRLDQICNFRDTTTLLRSETTRERASLPRWNAISYCRAVEIFHDATVL